MVGNRIRNFAHRHLTDQRFALGRGCVAPDDNVSSNLFREIVKAELKAGSWQYVYLFPDKVDRVTDQLTIDFYVRHRPPVIRFALDKNLIRVEQRLGEGHKLCAIFCHRQWERDDVSFTVVELFNGTFDTRCHFYLQRYFQLSCQVVQELVLIAHGLAFVNEVTDGIVVDQYIKISAFHDLIVVDFYLRGAFELELRSAITRQAGGKGRQND